MIGDGKRSGRAEHTHSLCRVFSGERTLQECRDVLPIRALGMIDNEPAEAVRVAIPTDAAGSDVRECGGGSALRSMLRLDLLGDETETAWNRQLREHQLEHPRFGGAVDSKRELDNFKQVRQLSR